MRRSEFDVNHESQILARHSPPGDDGVAVQRAFRFRRPGRAKPPRIRLSQRPLLGGGSMAEMMEGEPKQVESGEFVQIGVIPRPLLVAVVTEPEEVCNIKGLIRPQQLLLYVVR